MPLQGTDIIIPEFIDNNSFPTERIDILHEVLKSSFQKYFLFLDFDKNWRTFIDINLVTYNQDKVLFDGISI